MLTFVGLGLYDERSVTLAGRDAIAVADRVFAECYTSRLAGATVADLEAFHGVDIEVRGRDGVEGDPGPILDAAEAGEAAFLTGGDPMVSTTHVDLRLRAHDRGIDTRLVHGTSASTAAAGLTGLQNYRFGKATTLPFPRNRGASVPESVLATIRDNADRGLHAARAAYMPAAEAATQLEAPLDDRLAVAVARAGSEAPVVAADRCSALAERDLGGPLHLLVLPGELHPLEAEALAAFADAPAALLEAER